MVPADTTAKKLEESKDENTFEPLKYLEDSFFKDNSEQLPQVMQFSLENDLDQIEEEVQLPQQIEKIT